MLGRAVKKLKYISGVLVRPVWLAKPGSTTQQIINLQLFHGFPRGLAFVSPANGFIANLRASNISNHIEV